MAQRKHQPEKLVLERKFDAPAARVFDAFASAEQMGQWFGPESVACKNVSVDFRVGGRYSLEMHHGDGEIFPLQGEYIEITPSSRLVMTWVWGVGNFAGLETLVTLEFRQAGDTTLLKLTHENLDGIEARDMHGGGWGSSFDCLQVLLQK